MADINLARSIINGRRQAVLISQYVEDRELSHGIRMRICLSYIDEAGPSQSPRYPIPIVERRLGILVSAGEFAKRPPAYDAHESILS